ncbi:MAG: hypothetical protein AAB521_01700 [Patescibacteria group bacterium]
MTEFPTGNARGAGEASATPERPRTKIDTVRELLKANPDVHLAGELHKYDSYAPQRGYFTEFVSIIVSPKNPEFDVDRLNSFMKNLIAEVDSTSIDRARNRIDGGIDLGRLYYDEIIGTLRTDKTEVIETTEPETVELAGRKVGELKTTDLRDIKRRTWVRIYPDTLSADAVYEYEHGVTTGAVEPDSVHSYTENWLTGEQVRELKSRYSRGPVAMVKGFLQRGK